MTAENIALGGIPAAQSPVRQLKISQYRHSHRIILPLHATQSGLRLHQIIRRINPDGFNIGD